MYFGFDMFLARSKVSITTTTIAINDKVIKLFLFFPLIPIIFLSRFFEFPRMVRNKGDREQLF